MPSIFTRIINGEIPGRFVWRDDTVVAFLDVMPLTPGHTLVVPIQEVDYWIDAPIGLQEHVLAVANIVARALQNVYQPAKVACLTVGIEVPHLHVHLVPMNELEDLNFKRPDRRATPEELDTHQSRILAELGAMGHSVPS